MPETFSEIEWRVRQVATEEGGGKFESIRPDSRLIEDLGFDSLAIVEFVMGLEDAFGITIPDDDQSGLFSSKTIRDVALAIQRWPKDEAKRPIPSRQRGAPAEEVAFTQLGPLTGSCSQKDMFEPIGPNREGFCEFLRRRDGMRCVLVPSAGLQLGDPSSSRGRPETRISEFLLDVEPVSNAAYARFLNSIGDLSNEVLAGWCGCDAEDGRSKHFSLRKRGKLWAPVAGTERQPMILVSWFGASAYSLWANERDWRFYREENCLPTEAQWEYTSRGRSDNVPGGAVVGRHIPGSAYEIDSLPAVSVSARQAVSPFGAFHMGGNVWQWCADWFVPDYYDRLEGQTDPVQGEVSGIRSERGGSWVGPAQLALPWYRRGRSPEARGRCLGFRCCGSLPL